MKIVILTDDFPPESYGGAGIIAFAQAKELYSRGYEVFVITTTRNKKNIGAGMVDGILIHRIYANYNLFFRAYISILNPQTIFKVKNILKKIKPDIVHAHNIHQFLSYHTLNYAKTNSKKVFITLHDVMSFHYSKLYPKKININGQLFDYKVSWLSQLKLFKLQYNPLRNILIRKYFNHDLDRKFAVSEALRDALEQNGIYNVEVMHNGINVDEFQSTSLKINDFKRKFDLLDKKIILMAGRISTAKGAKIAISLIKHVGKVIPDAKLVIAGQKNEYTDSLVDDAKSLGMGSHVVITDWLSRDDVKSAFAASNIVLSLSTYMDPFPTVNLEAMAAGKPVMGTCYGGTPEIIKDGVNGYIVDPNSIEVVVQKTVDLLNNIDVAEKFGQAGFMIAKTDLSLSAVVDRLVKYYNTN